jgi:plastocyanin
MNRFRLPLLQLATALAIGLAGGSAWAEAPLDNATVSFGMWMSSPPLDRFPNTSNSRLSNAHVLAPNVVTIKAGGSVNFIVSGLHNIVIYGDGTEPGDINVANIITTTGIPNDVPLINDPTNRIYRGLDPSLQTADRVEVVQFPAAGTYLVICGVLPHFAAGMYGYVRVLPN